MTAEQEMAGNTEKIPEKMEKHVWHYSAKALRTCSILCGLITVGFLALGIYLSMTQKLGNHALFIWITLLVIPVVAWLWVGIVCWYRTNFIQYRLTESNLYVEKGFIHKTIDTMELMGIIDLKMEQSLLDRLFNGGTGRIIVFSKMDKTDSELVMSGIENPKEVLETIDIARRRMRGKGFVQM